MTTPDQPPQYERGYIFDQESATEMARLLLQDRLINRIIGELFPEQEAKNLDKIHTVLDVGCGTAGWILDVASKYPHMHIVGIDISTIMLAYANEQVKLHGLKNIELRKMDVLQKLEFPDQHFDFVNIRNAVGYVSRYGWPNLLKECYRITQADGILQITEADTMGLTNSPAYEKHHRLGSQVMQKLGYGFSPDGSTLGITPMLGKLLKEAGYTDIQIQSHFFDYSYGAPLHSSQVQNITIVFKASQPMLLKSKLISQADLETLYQEVLEQIEREDFRAMNYLLSAWGKR